MMIGRIVQAQQRLEQAEPDEIRCDGGDEFGAATGLIDIFPPQEEHSCARYSCARSQANRAA